MNESEIKKLHALPPEGCWQHSQVGGACPGTALHLSLAAARGRCREDGAELGNWLSAVARKQLAAPCAPAVGNTWWCNISNVLRRRWELEATEGCGFKQDEKQVSVCPSERQRWATCGDFSALVL